LAKLTVWESQALLQMAATLISHRHTHINRRRFFSILALATSSSVNATPLNPDSPSLYPSHIPFTFPESSEPARLHHNPHRRATIPDKYEQGLDGHWHKVATYTLYGSTICSVTLHLFMHTLTTKSVKKQNCKPTSTSSTSETIPSPTQSPDILDSLPSGWKPTTGDHKTRTAVILAMSLALAIFICFLISSCVFWRKSQRWPSKMKDEEMVLRRRRRPPDDNSIPSHKSKQRIWARATARWKLNARFMARQRRGQRTIPRQPKAPDVPPSPPVSASPGTSSRQLAEPGHSPPPTSPTDAFSTRSSDPTTLNPTHSSPPTYQKAILIPPQIHIPFESLLHESTPLASSSLIANALDDSTSTHNAPPYHTAHVATDDKAILGQMASLSSAPPSDGDIDARVSAPIWYDEGDDEFPYTDHCRSPTDHTPKSPFPPPPSGRKLAAEPLYDHTSIIKDVEYLGPDPGPSAPPFEESCPDEDLSLGTTPSAPPLDDLDLDCSAPNDDHESEPSD
jgi:hypothetical protein